MKAYLAVAVILFILTIWPDSAGQRSQSVASKKFTESVILGEMLRLLGQDVGLELGHLREAGGTQVVFRALQQDEIVAYVEYTGTIDQEILAGESDGSEQTRAQLLAEKGITISPSLGFQNTYALAMSRRRAGELGVSSISQLRNFPDLRYGVSNEFLDRGDGWAGLQAAYQLPGHQVFGLDHDLAYRQLAAGDIDVIDAYTTDAQLDEQDLITLADDRHYFPRYDAVILYRSALQVTTPKLVESWNRLAGTLTTSVVRNLNRSVESEFADESSTAARFLNRQFGMETRVRTLSRAQRIAQHVSEHLQLVRRSLFPAILFAVPMGIVASRLPALGQFLMAATSVIQTIPALALLVLLMPVATWLGLASVGRNSMTAIAALFLYSLLPISRNTLVGLQNVPGSLRDSADALGLRRSWRLNDVELPLATRTILAGIKTATVLNIGYATLGALIGAGGLGQPILTGIRLNRLGLILEGAVPAAILALVAQGFFEIVERYVVSRGLR